MEKQQSQFFFTASFFPLNNSKWLEITNFFFFFFGLTMRHAEILVPQPGIESVPSALGVQSLIHWVTREVQ